MSNIRKQLQISDLMPRSSNFFIICTLIGKSDARYFIRNNTNSETSFTTESNRGVQTLIVRDARALINCVVWGSTEFIRTLNQEFHISDIVRINSPVVSNRKYNDFEANTSSQFLLTINESKGDIVLAAESSLTNELRICLTSVFNKPIKPTSAAMRLSDISSRGTRSNGELYDLLVVVQRLRPIRQFQGQREGFFRDAIVMDASFLGMTLKIWNAGFVERSEKWQEMTTVLQLIDVRSMYSTYSKMVELSTNSRTLIVEQPDCPESRNLKTFAQNALVTAYNAFDESETVDLSTITNVMTCQQIRDRSEADIFGSEDHFTAVVFAVVTVYDLDGCSLVFSRRCNTCRKAILTSAVQCNNDDCIILTSSFESSYRTAGYSDSYNIRVSLSDFTDTLDTQMVGATAERIVGKPLIEFRALTDIERSKLKWKFLLERCKVKVIVKRKTAVRRTVSIIVLDCVVADVQEILTDIKAY